MDCKVAIVILNWNGKKYLEEFLPIVVANTHQSDYKVIVADNASTDDSIAYLKSRHSEIRLIELDQNYGYAEGYARALPQIKSEYYVLLNSDVEVPPHWLEPVIIAMDNDSSIAASMPKILAFNQKTDFEYAGASGGFLDKYGFPFCRGRILSSIEKDNGQYNSIIDVFWASGACMVIRSGAYFAAGGLDGDFFAHMEEIDLCWRLKRMGYRVTVNPHSSVFHVGGGTLPNNSPRKLYYNYRNSLFMLFKNLPSERFIPVVFTRLWIDFATALIYLLRFDFSFFYAVLRAHASFFRQLGKLYAKRQLFKPHVVVHQVSGIYWGSIVFDFLVRKKRFFTDLDAKKLTQTIT